ncbi:MAG: NAD-dependent epimerase/dehydratase family protein [Ferruginibacter sp.]
MTEKVLITGGSGFLGYHLIKAALNAGLEVYAAVRKNSHVEHLKDLPVKYTHLNYEDAGALQKELEEKGYSYVIHAAGVTKANSEAEYSNINAGYTVNLAKAAADLKGQVKKFVLISSLAATGPLKTAEGLITEDKNCEPVTAYGRSKLKAEQELLKIDIPAVILRPTAIYGPRDKDLF